MTPSWLSGSPAVVLTDTANERFLPIFIGEAEARSIELALAELQFPRPLTHDLLAEILREYGIEVIKVVVRDLEDGIFYADLYLRQGNEEKKIDARPSDAIAIALRTGAPIFVEEEVFEKAEKERREQRPQGIKKEGERI